jgi:toxin ParE1/3/4
MNARYRISPGADRDIEQILRETVRNFGTHQRRIYATLMEQTFGLLAGEPERPGSKARDDLGSGLRSFHVGHAAQRLTAASHVVFYEVADMSDGRPGVVIIRVLHERMDPDRHLPER